MKEKPTRKAFNFDLVDAELKKVYPAGERSYKNGYRDIKKFMERQGFIHHQGSGYYSAGVMDIVDITTLLEKMVDEMPWICECMRDLRVANYVQDRNLTHMVKEMGREMQKAQQQGKMQSMRQKSKEIEDEI
jgi:virulence-associated protein VapD